MAISPTAAPPRNDYDEQAARAQAEANQHRHTHELAAARGRTAEHIAARKAVIATFFQCHLPKKKEQAAAYVQRVDLNRPVLVVNAAGIDTAAAPSRGMLGLGQRPQFLVSEAVPPRDAGGPVYALRSFPAR